MKSTKEENQVTDNETIKDQESTQQEKAEATVNDTVEANEKSCDANMAEEAAKWQDKYIRLSAEFDNFRKRTLKEKMDLIETAGEDIIKAILVVVDDFDRAITANEKLDDIEVIKAGATIIHQKINDLLKQRGLQEIEAMGNELDTDLHEAIAKIPVEEKEKKGKIVDVVQKGYKLKDKVIRYSKVVVGE